MKNGGKVPKEIIHFLKKINNCYITYNNYINKKRKKKKSNPCKKFVGIK